jgi:hypothetical protein
MIRIFSAHSVQEIDRGWYMCQINTDPMVHRSGYLEVVGKSTEMEFLDIYLTKDSSIFLHTIHSLSTGAIKKIRLYYGLKIHTKNLGNKKTRVYL